MACYMLQRLLSGLLLVEASTALALPRNSARGASTSTCKKTKVAVLGAGVAGITAAQALSDNSVSDFLIVEYTGQIGGRCRPAHFGKDAQGDPYTVELGANWVQGTVSPGGPENPIWTLAKKYGVQNHFTDLSSLETFDESGPVDYLDKVSAFEDAYEIVELDSGHLLADNLQDRSFRAGLRLAGWNPAGDPQAQAVEYFEMDYEYAQTPDVSSQVYIIANFNSTFYGYSEANQFVYDPRGFVTFLHGQASEFLETDDSRLFLNTIVTNITYDCNGNGVVVTTEDGGCIEADYAITTFSVGVLQSGDVTFSPELPAWKQEAIQTFQMGVYTKIFFQFPPDKVFWNKSTEFFLYASKTRGYYPVWQSLDHEDFHPGSGIFFVTVVTEQSYIVDHQDDETTKEEIMVTLRQMFGADNVPEPIAFMYPRWSTAPWAYGSYSNWPPGLTLEGHQNLRANVGPVWFAGEATNAEFFGYLQAAYLEGKHVGEAVAACVAGKCEPEKSYSVLGGTSPPENFGPKNGWYQTSFQTIGDVGLVGGGG